MSQSTTLHLHAAAREAAGCRTLSSSQPTTAALRLALIDEYGDRMGRVLAVSTLLVDGVSVGPGADAPIPPGATVEVLPPFAGG